MKDIKLRFWNTDYKNPIMEYGSIRDLDKMYRAQAAVRGAVDTKLLDGVFKSVRLIRANKIKSQGGMYE